MMENNQLSVLGLSSMEISRTLMLSPAFGLSAVP
jgi:hypothetical protein